MSELAQEMREFRFDKMRLGKASCEIVEVPSMQGMRVALVPLTESEYDECLEMAQMIEAPENPAGWLRRDRRSNSEMLARAVRHPQKLNEPVFANSDEMKEILEVSDINFMTDMYMEMVSKSSPALDQFQEEDLEAAKKVLQTTDWNALSGRSWYALRRFLSSLGPTVPLDKSPGSFSTPSSIGTSEKPVSTPDASPN